jgi:hypothetical protein
LYFYVSTFHIIVVVVVVVAAAAAAAAAYISCYMFWPFWATIREKLTQEKRCI